MSWCGTRGAASASAPGTATRSVVHSVAISHDNRLVAVVNGYGHFRLYDIATGKEPRRFDIKAPRETTFTPDGRLLVTDGGTVRRWELASGKELPQLVGGRETGLAVAADGKTIATYTRSGDVRIWNADGTERCHIALAAKGMVASLSADGKQLACGTFNDGEAVHVFDAVTGRLRWRTKPDRKDVSWLLSAAAFSPDGRTLVGSGARSTLWDAATGTLLRQTDGLPYGITQHARLCARW